jgi:cytochrome P450
MAGSAAIPPIFPFASAHGLDAATVLARLRDNDPVPRVELASGGPAYLATRYDDVRRVFADPVFSRAAATRADVPVLSQVSKIPYLMMNMDPPDHTRIRRLVTRAFTSRSVERLRPNVRRICDALVDRMLVTGPPVDFVPAFAYALPAQVISELLGVPAEDRDQLRRWQDAILSISAHSRHVVEAQLAELMGYLRALINRKRSEPADDLVSALITAQDSDDRLSESELLYTVQILIAGGYETTAGLLANSIVVLHRNPEQWELLRDNPDLISGAVDELLRYVPIVWSGLERVTLSDVTLSGVPVPAGSSVIPLTYSANYDETLTEDAGRLDVTRPPVPHLAFGHGVHRCIGAPLAKVELEIAFQTLFARLPTLRMARAESQLWWKNGLLTVGPIALPVLW